MDQYRVFDHLIRQCLFQPSRLGSFPPQMKCHFVNLETQQGSVGILQYPVELDTDTRKKTIVYSHGRNDNISLLSQVIEHLGDWLQVNVVTYDYPSYGISDGTPTEESCTWTLHSTIEYLKTCCGIQERNMTLLGYSLGTGVVVDFAHRKRWKQPILLFAPFKSIPMVLWNVPWINWWVRKYKFASYQKIHELQCSIQIVHGVKDRVIPVSHGKWLAHAIPVERRVFTPIWLPDHGHAVFYAVDRATWRGVLTSDGAGGPITCVAAEDTCERPSNPTTTNIANTREANVMVEMVKPRF